MKKLHLYISGRVQGVGFRFSTYLRAKRNGLKGYVRNLSDGRVEAVLEGKNKKIEELLKWIKKGPIFSRVDSVDVKEEVYSKEFNKFNILY